MKNFFISILAIFYITVAAGIPVNIHYCMGDLASVEYGSPADDACGKCGMKEKKGCCDTEHKLVKLTDAHQGSAFAKYISATPAIAPPEKFTYASSSLVATRYIQPRSNAPPERGSPSLNILHCVFRI